MPTTQTWTGAVDGTFTTAGNWLSGTAPVGGDSVIFDRGNVSVTAGLSPAIAIATFTVKETYGGSIGGATLLTLTSITTLNYAGRGAYCKLGGTVTTAKIDLRAGNTFVFGSGTWTNVYVTGASGGMAQVTGATITNLYSVSSGVFIEANTGTTFTIVENRGQLKTARDVATYTGLGYDQLTTTTAAAIGTVANLVEGSVYNHQSSGTIALLNVRPKSSFPCIGSQYDFTITNSNWYSGGVFNINPPGVTITFTNPIAYIGASSNGFSSGGGPQGG